MPGKRPRKRQRKGSDSTDGRVIDLAPGYSGDLPGFTGTTDVIIYSRAQRPSCSRKDREPLRPEEVIMREYELMYIARPNLEAAQYEALQERVTGLIARDGGEMTGLEVWGKRKLAYPIKHEKEGYYVVLTFKGGEALVQELNRVLYITDEILRHKIFRLDGRR